MEEKGGVYYIPCQVNGLELSFIFDTGASDVNISMTEALFMVKNGYLSKDNFIGTEYYRIANGDITESTVVILDEIKIGSYVLEDVKASVTHELSAPLLLGQSALNKLGKIEFDYSTNTLLIGKTNINGNTSQKQISANSADKSKAELKAEKQVEMLDKELDLSDKQEAELTDVFTTANKNIQTLKGEDRRKAQEETYSNIKEVLNEEQLKEYRKLVRSAQSNQNRESSEKMQRNSEPQQK